MSSFTLGQEQMIMAPAATFEVAPVVLFPPIQQQGQTAYDAQKTAAINTLNSVINEVITARDSITSIVNRGADSFTRTDMDHISMLTYAVNKRVKEIIDHMIANPFFGDKTIPEVAEKWAIIDNAFADIDNAVDTTIPWMTALAQKLRLTIPTIGARDSKPVLSQQELILVKEEKNSDGGSSTPAPIVPTDAAVVTAEAKPVNPLIIVGAGIAAYLALKG